MLKYFLLIIIFFNVFQQLRGLSPLPPHQPAMVAPPGAPGGTTHPPAPPPQKGSIVAGYPVRTQAAPTSSNYPTPSSQVINIHLALVHPYFMIGDL